MARRAGERRATPGRSLRQRRHRAVDCRRARPLPRPAPGDRPPRRLARGRAGACGSTRPACAARRPMPSRRSSMGAQQLEQTSGAGQGAGCVRLCLVSRRFPAGLGSLGCRRYGLSLALSQVSATAAPRAKITSDFSRASRQKTTPTAFGPFFANALAKSSRNPRRGASRREVRIGRSLMIEPL